MPLQIATFPILQSRAVPVAVWCGRLALPVLTIAVAAHQFDAIETPLFFALLALGFGLALTGLLAALFAAHRIWTDGAEGARATALAFAQCLLALVPAMLLAAVALTLPAISQITTDQVDPPFFRRTENRTVQMNALAPPLAQDLVLQRAAYPDILTRRYELSVEQLDVAATRTVYRLGWKLVDHYRPVNDRDRGRIEAVARTPLLGLRSDIALRTLPSPEGARIDLHAVARFGPHDLGLNARYIRAFWTELELSISELYPQ